MFWTIDPTGFPFGRVHDPGGRHISVLWQAAPAVLAQVLAVVCLTGVGCAFAMTRVHGRGLARSVLLGWAWAMAACLALVIPDYRPLLAVVRAPMLLAGAPFGFPRQMSLAEFLPVFVPWPVLNQMLFIVGGILWAATALTFGRRTAGACRHCGRGARGVGRWTSSHHAARWGRIATYIAVAAPLLYCLSRWTFALGIPFGVSRAALATQERENPGIWIAGAMLATMGFAGALLTIGLTRRWGEVYPRWCPWLAGKRVRIRTAVVPASLAALLLFQTGLMELRQVLRTDRLEELFGPGWGLVLPGQLFLVWATALAAATLAYYLRRRGSCRICGNSDPTEQARPAGSGAG